MSVSFEFERKSVRRGMRDWTGFVVIVGLAASSIGCAAKVKQEDFDRTVGELRGEIAELDGRVSANEASLTALRGDLEALATELGDVRAAVIELEDGLRFAMPVHFDFDRAEIRPEDRPKLDRFAAVTSRYYPAAVITVEGFADPAGSEAYNLRLSERRARAVADYLTTTARLDPATVRTEAYGEERQVIPGAEGPGREGLENRRVTFVIEMGGELEAPRTVAAREGEG